MVASHEWGREGRGDCGTRVVIEESSVSRSSQQGAHSRHGRLSYFSTTNITILMYY